MMVLDGRQLPRSAGGAMEEIAQIMLEAGCVQAVNLDGGGSTTYMSKPAGQDEIDVINVPSDGYERRVATSLVAISTAPPSTAFDSAIISSDYEYITAGTSMQFSVKGVSNTGNAAVIPEGAYWETSDTNIGTIDASGKFTAVATGDVTVQFIVNDAVKGEKVIHVVIPDDIKFAEDRITAIYGEAKKMDITVWYQGKPTAMGISFLGYENCIRVVFFSTVSVSIYVIFFQNGNYCLEKYFNVEAWCNVVRVPSIIQSLFSDTYTVTIISLCKSSYSRTNVHFCNFIVLICINCACSTCSRAD